MIGDARKGQALVKDDQFEAFRAAISHRYRIERELGRGGMATVYLAHELKHGRPVALKVLRHEIASVIGSERFLREIEVTAHFTHPNILPLYDSDEAVGRLFYVMPFVEGGTLKDRLARPPIPSIAEALSLTRQVAAGLTYAHQHGVVHRDIKPANILLSSGHAFIADFGIARAVRQKMTEEQLTATGLAVGTPAYMAPEQNVTSTVDGRADEYALACVLHEMLLGSPPSHHGGPISVRRALRASRSDVPARIEEALERALSLDPSKRFTDVAEFAAALEGPVAAPRPGGVSPRKKVIRIASAAALTLIAVILILVNWKPGPPTPKVTLPDTTRYAILPMEYQSGITQSINEEQLLHDALARWSGLSVVDHFQVRDALERHGPGPLTSQAALAIARELGAGRFVRGEVSMVGDSLRVHATLYDVPAGGKQLSDGTIKIESSLAGADALFTSLGRRLLLRGASSENERDYSGSLSLPARQAYGRGDEAIQAWNLASADSAYSAAGRIDPSYAEAHLWLALVRAWSGEDPATWRYAVEQALVGRARLSSRDQAIAEALRSQSSGEMSRACDQWTGLTKAFPADFVGWFGAAYCKGSDDIVIRDSKSPSGYRFRSSYHEAIRDYRHAFQLLPSILVTFRGGAYETVRRLLRTEFTDLRAGRSILPDTTTFLAYPSWLGDTLALIPYPAERIRRLDESPSLDLAVRHQRELFHDIALTWRSTAPQSPYAVEALAIALELLGDRTALDTIRLARRLATDPEDAHRIACAEVRMRLKFALPDDERGMRVATALADSLLRAHDPEAAPEADALLGLAVITGRANTAAILSRRAAQIEHWTLPGPIAGFAPALLTFAALGGPIDSIRLLSAALSEGIDQIPSPSLRERLRSEWIGRAGTLAFPNLRLNELQSLAGTGDYLVEAQLAFARGDADSVRRILNRVRLARIGKAPSDLALDALYPEAWLLTSIGDDSAAAAWLDPTLRALALAAPRVSTDPASPGALVRAMALRAELARRLDQPEQAKRWASAVKVLWKDADPFLQPVVLRMSRISAGQVVPDGPGLGATP